MLAVTEAPLLAVEDLQTKFFGARREFTAVDQISFELNRDESLAIVGESGGGILTPASFLRSSIAM